MKHLKTFENYKPTNEEFDFSMSPAEIGHLVKTLPPLMLQLFAIKLLIDNHRSYRRREEEEGPSFAERFFLKPFRKAVDFFKTAPDKIVDAAKNAAEEIESIGMEEEAKKWILDNVVNNKEFQDELKSIESNIKTVQGEISDIDKRRTGASQQKLHHLDQITTNKKQMLDYYNQQKNELSNKAKAIVDKLQSENPPLYKALMRSMQTNMDKIYNFEQ